MIVVSLGLIIVGCHGDQSWLASGLQGSYIGTAHNLSKLEIGWLQILRFSAGEKLADSVTRMFNNDSIPILTEIGKTRNDMCCKQHVHVT